MPENLHQRRWEAMAARGMLLLALLIFGWRAFDNIVPTFYGLADEHGYMTTAKQLALHGRFSRRIEDPYAFVGETLMQSERDPAEYYLRQPAGYPILCAGAYWAGGPDGPFAVNPLMGLVLIGGVYVLGKELGSPLMGAAAGLVIALHPLVLYYTIMALSHIPDMATATWTIAFALMWRRERQGWQAGAVGLLLGAAIWIRYTNGLLLLPLGVILWDAAHAISRRSMVRHAAAAGATLILLIAPLLAYHAMAFGGALRTGYSVGGNGSSFSWAWLVAHMPAMTKLLMSPGTGLGVLLIGVLIGVIVMAKRTRFTLLVLLTWAIPPLLLYTAYYGMPANNVVLYARFALSSFVPLILLAALWPAWMNGRREVGMGLVASLVIAAVGLGLWSPYLRERLTACENEKLFMFSTRQMVLENVPAGSVVVASNFTNYFLDYASDYVVYDPELFEESQVAKRVADLSRQPREFDPARTKQIDALVGGKTDAALAQLLRERLKLYADTGKKVMMVSLMAESPTWAQRLHVGMTQVQATQFQVGLYRLDFER